MSTFENLSKKYKLKQKKRNCNKVFSKDLDITELTKITEHIYNTELMSLTIEQWYRGILLTESSEKTQDCMEYVNITEKAKTIFDILNIPLTPIMSRIGVLFGDNDFTRDAGWHVDQCSHEMLRVNIPIITNENFVFQMDNELPRHFAVGKLYWWETAIPHRVYSLTKISDIRLHLVLGFSPWFIYNHESREWSPNQFFNKIHPLDILKE